MYAGSTGLVVRCIAALVVGLKLWRRLESLRRARMQIKMFSLPTLPQEFLIKWGVRLLLFVGLIFGAYLTGRLHEARLAADKLADKYDEVIQLVEEKGKLEADLAAAAAERKTALEQRHTLGQEGLNNAIEKSGRTPACDLSADELRYYSELTGARSGGVSR